MTAILPYGSRDAAPLVHLAAHGIAADVSLSRNSRYDLRLAAEFDEVSARLVGTTRTGEIVDLGELSVPPGSAGASRFPLAVRSRAPIEHVYLEIAGGGLRLRVEAPPPPRRRVFGPLSLRIAAGSAGVVCVVAGALLAVAVPQAPTLVTPGFAVAGEVARLGYATHGFGTASFRATSEDGRPLGAGVLNEASGEIAVAIPRSSAHRRVKVALRVRGPLRDVSRTVSFAVVAPPSRIAPALSLARIAAFSVRRDRDGANGGILASYLAVADRGVLTVSDDHGRALARAPFSHTGTQRLALPAGSDAGALVARLDVRRDGTAATASMVLPAAPVPAAIAPLAAPDDGPAVNEAPASVDDPGTTATSSGGDPIAIVGKAVAGRPFTVAIRTAATAMRLRLEDDAANAVAETAVRPGARSVSLVAPASTVARTYYLTCSYSNGTSQEAIVRSVRVAPR